MAVAASVLQSKPRPEKLATGISDQGREAVATSLQDILASTYRLLIKTQIHHWNVVGPLFYPIHLLTDEQYNDLFKAIDTIAERIRALGYTTAAPVIGTEKQKVVDMSAQELLEDLIGEHEDICRKMRAAASAANDADDIVTNDMLIGRLTFHEKAVWMLKSILVA